MSEKKYYSPNMPIDSDQLKEALESMSSKKVDMVSKNYDPYEGIETIVPLIDKIDKSTDKISLAMGLFPFFISIFFLLFSLFDLENFIFFIPLIISELGALILLYNNQKNYKQEKEDLKHHRISYFDKQNLMEVLNERKNKKNTYMGICIGLLAVSLITLNFIKGLIFLPFFVFSISVFIYNFSNYRIKNIENLIYYLKK